MTVLKDRYDPIACQAVSLPAMSEGLMRQVEAVEPAAKRSNPEHARSVHVERPDVVIAKAIRILWVVLVARDHSGGRLQTVEPTCGSDP